MKPKTGRPSKARLAHLKRIRAQRGASRVQASTSSSAQDVVHAPTEDTDDDMNTDQLEIRWTREEVTSETENRGGFVLKGKRIVDINFFIQQLFLISSHSSIFGCKLTDVAFRSEKRTGLQSTFFFKCNICGKEFTMETSRLSTDRADINQEVVSGIMSLGCGFTHLKMILACLNIPSLTFNLYRSIHDTVSSWWKLAAEHSMSEAAKQEADHAKATGSTDTIGTPMITVVGDGCWSKRSYGNNYSALSGAAAIIGHYTGKVLYYGVKNKYCLTCARATNKGSEPPKHTCFKNYKGSSSGMESSIISEGFQNSLSKQGLIYCKIIADGDSCTYSAIRDKRPYQNLTVAKLYCKNHLLRNYCKALLAICSDTKLPIRSRKFLRERYLRLRWAVDHIIKHWNSQNLPLEAKIQNVAKDILNSPYHVFGDHKECASYFCISEKRKPDEENLVTELSVSGVFQKISNCVFNLAQYSNSLIHNVTSNAVECFNAKIAKFVGGKRVNYSSRNSYETRCAAAVVSYNTGYLHTSTHNTIFSSPANSEIVGLEAKLKAKPVLKKKRKTIYKPVLQDASYGKNCQKPDMDNDVYIRMKDEFTKKLVLTSAQRQQLERDTVLQSDNPLWLDYRRMLLTASWFGKVCKRRVGTDCKNLVKAIIYGKNLDHVPAIMYGKNNEHTALAQLAATQNIHIERCGLFVDKEFPFLGATPDGLYSDGIVEVKCPISAKGLTPEAAILAKKITFWKATATGNFVINKTHPWFYQVQGQLHITNANVCLFCVWLDDNNMKIELIARDDQFWKDNMEPKLRQFYSSCLLPELVDPRFSRSMELRSHSAHVVKALQVQNN